MFSGGSTATSGGAFGGDFGTRGFWSGHTGATIGDPSAAIRNVSPLAFVGAERYHGGGTLGLRPDEVPFIGLRGEKVLNPVETRAYNAGQRAAGGVGQAAPVNLTVLIKNESGQQVQAQQTGQVQWSNDMRSAVVTVMLDAVNRNFMGARDALRG